MSWIVCRLSGALTTRGDAETRDPCRRQGEGRAVGPEIQVGQTTQTAHGEDVIPAGTTFLSEHALWHAEVAALRPSRRILQTGEGPTATRGQSCSSKTLVVQLVKSVRVLPQLPSVSR
jgi:hypothetical protein